MTGHACHPNPTTHFPANAQRFPALGLSLPPNVGLGEVDGGIPVLTLDLCVKESTLYWLLLHAGAQARLHPLIEWESARWPSAMDGCRSTICAAALDSKTYATLARDSAIDHAAI